MQHALVDVDGGHNLGQGGGAKGVRAAERSGGGRWLSGGGWWWWWWWWGGGREVRQRKGGEAEGGKWLRLC